MRKLIIPIVLGVTGVAVLLALGIWQSKRLVWKQGVLSEIEARIADDPIALADATLSYQSVQVSGSFTGDEVHVLASTRHVGAMYRIIGAFVTDDGQTILIDRGYVRLENKDAGRLNGPQTITGNLHTPDEVDGFTPEPDITANIWYARDVPAIAAHLNTDQVFIIARSTSQSDPDLTPLPVDTSSIPNDHLGYAITWFSLAFIWLVMTSVYIWRNRRNS